MQRTFSSEFDSVFESSNLIKLCIQWNRKELSTFILALVSQHHLSCPFWCFFWKSQFNQNEEDSQQSFWGGFIKKWTFRKSQFNESEQDFQVSFWLCFHSKVEIYISLLFWKSQFNQNGKDSLNASFSFGFTPKTKLSLWVIFLKSQFNQNEKDS